MAVELEALFAAIRAACSSAAWSQGVSLARAGAVRGEHEDDGAVALRVATHGGLVSPAVHLELDPPDWSCDCASREDACEHAAAAVIALRQARRSGERLPGADRPSGRIAVRLARSGGALHFERAIVVGEREELLQSTLAALASGRVDGPAIVATAADLAVERALGTRLRGELPRGLWPALLAALAGCDDVTLAIEREGDALAVLALLVYGDPPTARVDAGRLVPLGGALPLRDEAAERALLRRLASELELAPGRRLVVSGGEALVLADRLRR